MNNNERERITKNELELLKNVKTEQEWNNACNNIKRNHYGQYPSDWYKEVIIGMQAKMLALSLWS